MPDVFLAVSRTKRPFLKGTKKAASLRMRPLIVMVSRARVELARRSHCHLKTACLPIPPPRRTRRLLLESGKECKQKFRKILFVTKRPRNGFDILPRLRRGIPIGSDSNEPHHRRVPASTRAPEPFPLHRLTRPARPPECLTPHYGRRRIQIHRPHI